MITPKDFWNMRSRNFDEQIGPIYQDAYAKTVSNTLKYLKAEDRVLDFACGTGTTTFEIAPHVAHVRAIDISDEMVEKAKAKAADLGADNVEISQGELFDPSLTEGSFDAVMAFNILLYLDNEDEILARIRSLLKPGGMFLSATDCLGDKITKVGLKKFWKSHTGSMPYVAFYRMKGLEELIARSGFTVLERENLFPAPPNLFVAARKE